MHRRASSVITDKKCLILDVDNTLIYVRHFMDEMRVGDRVKLGERDAVVIKITYRLDLEFSENPGNMSAYDHVLQSKDDSIPQRGEWFPDELSKVAIIHQADPTGCVIKLEQEKQEKQDNNNKNKNEDEDDDDDEDEEEEEEEEEEIEISFLQNSDELSQLEPMMDRDNYLSVTFMYGGYLVRIRPGLGKFLSLCNSKYDVILFTAADGSVYQGLLKQVHHILKNELQQKQELNNDEIDFIIPDRLWQHVYFRNDCDEKYDEYGLPYRHKNLAKLGRELSTIVMVDDNPLSYRGFEPNSVRVAGFWGLSQPEDNELLQTLFPTLWTIADHKDVRYHLSGLGQPPPDVQSTNSKNILYENNNNNNNNNNKEDGGAVSSDDNDEDLLTRQRRHSRQASAKFLQHLKEAIVAENESLEESTDDDDDADTNNEHLHNHQHHDDNAESTMEDEDDEQSSPPVEQTPDDNSHSDDDSNSNSDDDNASVDSISSNKMDEIANNNNNNNNNGTTLDTKNSDTYPDDSDDAADKLVNKYISMTTGNTTESNVSNMSQENNNNNNNNESSTDILGIEPIQNPDDMDQNDDTINDKNNGNKYQMSNSELDDIFAKNDNNNNNNKTHNDKNHTNTTNMISNASNTNTVNTNTVNVVTAEPHNRQISDSGIGNAGTLIFDNYDEDILFRDAYDSPKADVVKPEDMLQKRPSIELDLDEMKKSESDNINKQQSDNHSRHTAPNSPNDEDLSPRSDEEEDDESGRGGDYVLSPPMDKNVSGSASISDNKGDTQLLNKYNGNNDEYKDKDPTISDNSKHDGFISINDVIEMGQTGTRRSRTPTPISDIDAEILIEKTSGCSCFGWFGKKKKNKNIGLAQQELR